MIKTIAILGGKGSGKSTAGKYLADKYGAVTYALAAPIKEILRGTLGLSQEQLYGTQMQKETVDPKYGLSPRDLMVRQGDALRSTFGENVLVDLLLHRIAQEKPRLAVITDVRRLNEADRVRGADVVLWRLHHAPGLRKWPVTHVSEAEWSQAKVDLEITPGIGVKELHVAIDEACAQNGIEPTVGTWLTSAKAGEVATLECTAEQLRILVDGLSILDWSGGTVRNVSWSSKCYECAEGKEPYVKHCVRLSRSDLVQMLDLLDGKPVQDCHE